MAAGGDDAVLSVADTGPGLTAEQVALLFRPFSQVHDPPDGRPRGAGLGLSISRRLVEAHDGRLWVESQGLGHGSRFVFSLPTTRTAHVEAGASAAPLAKSP